MASLACEAGYLPLFDRDISFELGKAKLYLSAKRALELTIHESDFYLRVGGRILVDLTKYYEDKNDLGSTGLGLRSVLVEADGRWGYEYRFLDRDGRVTWVRGYAAALRDEKGGVVGYVGTNVDITAEKRREGARE